MPSQKHKLAKTTEQYGDYGAMVAGIVALAALIGAISAPTLLPSYGTAGLFSLTDTFFSLGGAALSFAAVTGSGAAIYMYGSNQTKDAILNVDERWEEPEAAAFGFGFGFPIAYEVIPQVSDIFVGSVGAQLIGVGAFSYCLFYLSDL